MKSVEGPILIIETSNRSKKTTICQISKDQIKGPSMPSRHRQTKVEASKGQFGDIEEPN